MKGKLGSIGMAFTAWQVARAVREHWLGIPAPRRKRAAELLAHSRLLPSNLSRAQRAELRELIAAMRLGVLGRRLAAIAFAKRTGPARGWR